MNHDMPRLLEMIGLDQQARQTLKEAGRALENQMPSLLGDQMRLIRGTPDLIGMFKGDDDLQRVGNGQAMHLGRLFLGDLGSDFADEAMKIGQLHFRAGLGMDSYFAAYARTLAQIQRVVLDRYARRGKVRVDDAEKLVSAATKAVLLDQLLALEGYLQAQRQDFSERLGRLSAAFEGEVGDVSGKVHASAEQLAGIAETMSRGTLGAIPKVDAAVSAAGDTASKVISVSSAAEQMSVAIKEITRQVGDAHRISADATAKAEKSDGLVRALRVTGDEIGGVVELISDIASQTNLLALNASVEAARAGEAGKGFAVVASEVKHLSMRISQATTDISRRIEQMHHDMIEAVTAIHDVGNTIRQLAEISSGISVSVEQQKKATDDIARNAEATATGTDRMTRNIEAVSGVVRQTNDATANVALAAKGMQDQSNILQRQIRNFVAGIRAA